MAEQFQLSFTTRPRSSQEISGEINRHLSGSLLHCGIAHIFVRHTSCGIAITENADADVRHDLESLLQRWAPDGDPIYRHDQEGDDDMAAHARSLLTGVSVSVPFAEKRLLLGTWQGIYLFEHRAQSHRRDIILTLLG